MAPNGPKGKSTDAEWLSIEALWICTGCRVVRCLSVGEFVCEQGERGPGRWYDDDWMSLEVLCVYC